MVLQIILADILLIHCSHFFSPLRGSEKYYATRKISARITRKTIEYGICIDLPLHALATMCRL